MDLRDFKAFQSVRVQTANPRCEFAELPGTENWTENVNIFEEEEDAMNVDGQIRVLRPSTHLRCPPARYHLESRAIQWDPAAPATACAVYGLTVSQYCPPWPTAALLIQNLQEWGLHVGVHTISKAPGGTR